MRKKAITGFGIMLIFTLVFSVFFFINFKTVIVSGQSMEDTFHNGDRLLSCRAYWLVGNIRVGDVVVIHSEDDKGYIIKRVRYLAGSEVDYLNTPEEWKLSDGKYIVPKDSVFVLGDNYYASEDSRKFGAVPTKRILGKIVRVPESWSVRLGVSLLVVAILAGIATLFSLLTSRRRSTPDA
jgi:signal peptidase I